MSRDESSFGRRSVLRTIGAAGLGLTAIGTAQAAGPDRVPVGEARDAAARTVQRAARRPKTFGEWRGATVGEPTLFHAQNEGRGPEYVPSVYVFAVRKNGRDVGYVTTGANDAWSAVVEYSPATPPQREVATAKATARENGATPSGRLLYHGGVKYGIELDDDRAVNVRNGRPEPVTRGVDFEQIDADQTSGGVTTLATDYDYLWEVPAWEDEDNDGSWDGCAPIAGSMIIGFHEGNSQSDTGAAVDYTDELHQTMNTDSDGYTNWWDIDDGFDKFSGGSNSYDGTNIYAGDHSYPDFTIREISDNARPFICNMSSAGSADDRSQGYGDHSVCVVGYDDGVDEFIVHDTWDNSSHHFDWGNWSSYSYTAVTVS